MRVLRFIRDTAIDLCLGCRHDRVTRPFTIEDESYMVCLDCGKQLFYSLYDMRRLSGRELRRMRAARATRHAGVAVPNAAPAVGLEAVVPEAAHTLALVPRLRGSRRAA